jgi:alkylhydroperoxidase/carboxymuconolactone decarboxylase family protein YurZ
MNIASIERQQRTISLESSTLTNTISAVTTRLPGFVADVNTFIRGLFDLEESTPKVLVGDSKLRAAIKDKLYTDLMDLPVYTPPGLSCSYVELVKTLSDSEEIASALLKDVLVPFNKWIATQLSSPDRLLSISSAHIPGIHFHDIKRASKELADCYSNSSSQVEVKFGSVFKRNSEFFDAGSDLNTVMTRASQTNPALVREKIEEVTDNLNKLVERIEADPETYKVSGAVVKSLAEVAVSIAKECEFYSVFQYQLRAAVTAYADSEERLSK